MDVLPTIRAALNARVTPQRVQELRGLLYADYLQTPEWRRTRDAAIRAAGWRCTKCQRKDNLQVHHRTYDRLGCEQLDDLEVVCKDCHQGIHIDEGHERYKLIAVYVKLASQAIQIHGPAHGVSDLEEAIVQLCRANRIAVDRMAIRKAIEWIEPRLYVQLPAPVLVEAPAPKPERAPIAKREAADIWRGLGFKFAPSRHMPALSDYELMLIRDRERDESYHRPYSEEYQP